MRILFLGLLACGNPPKSSFPTAASSDADADTDSDTDTDADADGDCADEWVFESQDVAIQPGSCLAWSEESQATMDWYAAVSPEEAIEGDCRDACPEEGEGYCAGIAGLGGRDDWSMPSKQELFDVAQSDPPWNGLDQWLWTLDTDANVPDNAWSVNLSDGGATWGKPKEGVELPVRCVSESSADID
jgi:hypothetical protein